MENRFLASIQSDWLAVGEADHLDDSPLKCNYAGNPIVVWRTNQGELCALADQCPHKGASLALGRLDGNAIACRYHGYAFDGDGSCITRDGSSLFAARYDVCEAAGILWAARKPITPAPPFFTVLPTSRRSYTFSDQVQTFALNVIDNLFDTSHFSTVHQSSFSYVESQALEGPEFEVSETGFTCQYSIPINPQGPFKNMLGSQVNRAQVSCEYFAPFTQIFTVTYNDGQSYSSVQSVSPTGPRVATLYQTGFSSHKADSPFYESDRAIWLEDKRVLETIKRDVLTPFLGRADEARETHSRFLAEALTAYCAKS
jgi:phenylpropionate dioxygenase-like ring-hydroxylating dioxygenase large terminal subunit